MSKQQKTIKKSQKNDKNNKKEKKSSGLGWLFAMCILAVGLLVFCQVFYGENANENLKFSSNTIINGVDVSGLNKQEASNVVSAKMLDQIDEVSLDLAYQDKHFVFKGSDFEVNPDISSEIEEVLALNQGEKEYNISYAQILGGMENKIDEVATQIECEAVPSSIIFSPNGEQTFSYSKSQNGIKVEKEKLLMEIKQSLTNNKNVVIQIPITQILPDKTEEDIAKDIALRSRFVTNFSNSSAARKNNICLALSSFNGLIVEPNERVSFNDTTGPRSEENGYQKASIIKNGVFVDGSGGGVCQASTTLYNALLLCGADIEEVHHHSLPVSYVPLSCDAMVSEGYADLVFCNNLDTPLYIKAYGDYSSAVVEIYGAPFPENVEYKIRSELIKILPHNGDEIIEDVKGQYSSQVLYKGEYYRIKYPKEGYETKSYLQRYEDGVLAEEKLIRHDFYYPQDGVVVEGSYSLGEGMTIPPSDVKIISAQKLSDSHIDNMRAKFEKTYPSAYEA